MEATKMGSLHGSQQDRQRGAGEPTWSGDPLEPWPV